MAKAMVHCRACGGAFDRNALIEGVDWVKPSNRVYYHKKCYEEYQSNKKDIHSKLTDANWFDATWEYLRKDLKGDFNYAKVRKQWDSFLKKKMTAKGMYFSLKYFYGIKKNDVTKSENGIGIIPHIYEESCTYWIDREEKDSGICSAIEQQILEAANAKVVVVNRKKEKKKIVNAADRLAAIMDMEDDE